MEGGGGGGFGFPFGGDPEDLMRGLREFAEQQAESVQDAQREQFATLVTLLDKALVRMLPVVPKPVVQLFSSRYIAGTTLDEAVAVVRALNRDGKLATVDVLGEEITRESEAREIAQTYCDVFTAIQREQLNSNVSVKLTALGLKLSYELCRDDLESVLREAARLGNFVRIDM